MDSFESQKANNSALNTSENQYSSCKKEKDVNKIISELKNLLNMFEEDIKIFSNKNFNNRNAQDKNFEMEIDYENDKETKTNSGIKYNQNTSFTSIENSDSFNSNNNRIYNIKSLSIISLDEKFVNLKKDNIQEPERENCREKQKERKNDDYISISPKQRNIREIENLDRKNKFSKFSKADSDEINYSVLNTEAFINKIINIENTLRNYLKDSHKFFKTKSIDDFIENSCDNSSNTCSKSIIPEFDKLQNVSIDSVNSKKNFERKSTFQSQSRFTSAIANNVNNSNYSIPSIFKNFFEEKETKIVNEKIFMSNLKEKNRFDFSNTDYKKDFSNFNKVSNFTNFLELKANENAVSDFGTGNLNNKEISGFSFESKVFNYGENIPSNREIHMKNFCNDANNNNNRRKSFPIFIKRQSSILTESLNESESIKENNSEYDNNSILYEEERDDINMKY
jgi:hypothetical protein